MASRKQKVAARMGDSRYVRWRNDTGREVHVEVNGKLVPNWYSTRIYSLPFSATSVAKKAGLTRLGLAQ